jgi:hypothetical protein
VNPINDEMMKVAVFKKGSTVRNRGEDRNPIAGARIFSPAPLSTLNS